MPRKTRTLSVTVTFETNRLEEQNINMAYELILPIKHGVRSKPRTVSKTQSNVTVQATKQLEIFSKASNQ